MRLDLAFSSQRLCVLSGITVRSTNNIQCRQYSDLYQRVSFCSILRPIPNERNALGDWRQAKHGITFVMWIVIALEEIFDLLLNNVRGPASWILIFLDILKIIGNS